MPHALGWIEDELAALEDRGLRRRLAMRSSVQSAEIEIDGRKLLNFGSNDYLGLAAGCLTAAVREALQERGWGSGASALVTGRGVLHARLEEALAQFEGTEAALLLPSGYAANVGTIAALVGQGDVIFSDAKNHASIVDGCRLSGARIQIYPHRDVDYLRMMLPQAGGFRRRLIVTDGLFSMDGDLAPLCDLADLAERFEAMLMVDEAHATGVLGEHGRGSCEHWGVEEAVPVRVGTLSKAIGSIGGFVAGSRPLVDWLTNRSRPYIFSTAPPEAVAAAGLAGLERIRNEPWRRTELLERSAQLRTRLLAGGWDTAESQSQIIPLVVGEPTPTMRLTEALREQGILVPGIRPPSVPQGESLLRISVTYSHTADMLDRLTRALDDALRNSTLH